MGKVYQNKTCDTCGKVGKVIETWGKKYCRACWDAKPKKGGGHSGMLPMAEFAIQAQLWFEEGLHLVFTPKGNKVFASLFLEHYPQSKGILGRQRNFLVKRGNDVLGIIGGNSPPLNYKKFTNYFGVGYTELNWLNNNVFRLIVRERNLGTKTLRMFRERIVPDYEEKYGDKLIGLVTFVEPPRDGAVYKADNWDYLGMTQGKHMTRRGDHGKWINKEWSEGTPKRIFAKKLKNYRDMSKRNG